ncbi:hypothetical protein [uncultured Cellulomonas sp.]|uniref:hypothetical protein n=1 Tax=uncultured Cellulomonas sp. TaxID=189682 RepID=UPI0028EC5373|nr:hypothetical protein [uncultured Cellulomonas sp.]
MVGTYGSPALTGTGLVLRRVRAGLAPPSEVGSGADSGDAPLAASCVGDSGAAGVACWEDDCGALSCTASLCCDAAPGAVDCAAFCGVDWVGRVGCAAFCEVAWVGRVGSAVLCWVSCVAGATTGAGFGG